MNELDQLPIPLLQWYHENARVLPWRSDPTPYHVWVSEIMLQQTRVAAVLGYYARFMEALPAVADLAAVEEDRLMKLWQGLGYYNRARNLQKAARQIVEEHGGVFPHTYEAIATGKVDSKFGSAIETGQAEEITAFTLAQPHVELMGFHCHVGSQVFAEDVFERAEVIMLEFIADMEKKHGFVTRQLDLGGGYGVRYVESDPYLDVDTKVGQVAAAAKGACERLGIALPEIHMEPGRSIVADAGLTLYTVGTVKQIPGYKNYVSIDGGMPDNPRFALYKADYTCLPASRMDEPRTFACSVVGRCCESGDIIQEHVSLPESVGRGDILAVCTTGAYNYSMASNYNRLPRPPIVMLRGGSESYVAVRRESLEDLCRNDL